jgi:hypothetical protein
MPYIKFANISVTLKVPTIVRWHYLWKEMQNYRDSCLMSVQNFANMYDLMWSVKSFYFSLIYRLAQVTSQAFIL